MPAEWERHSATWLTWPKNKITWPGKLLKRTEAIYIQMILGLLPGEKVQLLVDDDKTAKKVLSLLPRSAKTQNLVFHKIKTVDTWIRDYGPIFLKKFAGDGGRRPSRRAESESERTTAGRTRESAFTKWIFNAWGGKYADLATDTGVVDRTPYFKNFKRFDTGIILEGGSIDVNGKGTLLTTEQCLLNKNRNKHLSKKQIENYLKRYLGVRKIIWLKEGIEGDDTDGHVDDITRFVAPRTILTATESDPRDKNHEYLKENLEILKRSTDQDDKKFKIVELPMPGYVTGRRVLSFGERARVQLRTSSSHLGHPSVTPQHEPDRLPASYANFYIGNHSVLAPIYSHSNDKTALKILKSCFPTRKILGIECSALVYGLGSIHCVSQQEF